MPYPIFPTVNASLNALAGIFLFLGWRAIKAKNPVRHRKLMTAAFISSSAFLVSYVIYHITIHGVTHYQGQGISRAVYFFILLTHTILAVLIVPFILRALWHAYKKDFYRHKRITKWLLPVWMYVSVTGVVIYVMLYVL